MFSSFSSFSPSAEAHRLVIHHRLNLTIRPVEHTASSRRFADCSAGVVHPSRQVCCNATCGLCGGHGCSGRPGGPRECCMPAILSTGRVCESRADVACILRGSSNYIRGDGVEHASQTRSSSAEVAIGIAMKLCAAGIEHATLQVCCNASCGQCGRHGCASAPGGPRQCCMPAILRDGKRCLSSRDVGCVMRRQRGLRLRPAAAPRASPTSRMACPFYLFTNTRKEFYQNSSLAVARNTQVAQGTTQGTGLPLARTWH